MAADQGVIAAAAVHPVMIRPARRHRGFAAEQEVVAGPSEHVVVAAAAVEAIVPGGTDKDIVAPSGKEMVVAAATVEEVVAEEAGVAQDVVGVVAREAVVLAVAEAADGAR